LTEFAIVAAEIQLGLLVPVIEFPAKHFLPLLSIDRAETQQLAET
jgi:hypothetical protein